MSDETLRDETLPRATAIVRKAAIRPDAVADSVTLDHAGRQGAPALLAAAGGLRFSVALAKPASLDEGDAFRLDDGRLVSIRAAGESLLEVRAENPARLLRLAWQLGGSHVPAEIGADALYVPATAAVAELVRGQGCAASPVTRAFKPEREAHDHSQCGHDHGHEAHSHEKAHSHEDHSHEAHDHAGHDHGHEDHGHEDHGHESHGHAHVHGPGCQHDH